MILGKSSALVFTSLIVLGAGSAARPAHADPPARTAQSPNGAAAESLFEDGKHLVAEGRYAEACPKFEESEHIDPGVGTKFHLADCWQRLGRTATALSLFRDVESEAHASEQFARARVAHDRAAAIATFVPKLVIALHDPATLARGQILRDGVEVSREQWNAAVPVDPGRHSIVVSAYGKEPWQTIVDVAPQGKIVTVDVPALAEAPAALVVAPPGAPPAVAGARPPLPPGVTEPMPESAPGVGPAVPNTSPEQPIVDNHGVAQRAAGWVFVGAGVAGLATGAYFGARWLDERDKGNANCTGALCNPTGAQARSDARASQTLSIATGSAGAGALILGAILVATAPAPHIVGVTTAVHVEPMAAPRGANGLSLVGSF